MRATSGDLALSGKADDPRPRDRADRVVDRVAHDVNERRTRRKGVAGPE
ncbi:hypothetical protein [Alloactinosynnema sp. L-07]|nr:hypothetical protein [Alloactinosynnema sp. L-07]